MNLTFIFFLFFFKLRLTFTQEDVREIIINTTYNGESYVIESGLGTPIQRFKFAYDINSYDNFVSSIDCSSCKRNKYNYNKSKTFENKLSNDTFFYFNGTKKVLGSYFFDTFTLDNNLLYLSTFLLANYSELPQYDGIIGYGYDYTAAKKLFGASLLDTLSAQMKLKNRMFTQRIINSTNAKLILGSFPMEIATGKESYTRCKVDQEIKWGCQITHLLTGKEFNNLASGFELGDEERYDGITFSTISDSIQAPYYTLTDFLNTSYFKNKLYTNDIESNCYYQDDGIIRIYCTNSTFFLIDIPSISFVINNVAYIYEKDDIFTYDNKIGLWRFNIVFNKDSRFDWIFGQYFLRNYYTVFDRDNRYIGFYGGNKYDFNTSYVMVYIIISISSLVVVIITIFLIVNHCKRREADEFRDEKVHII
jgi:hypothetical protein